MLLSEGKITQDLINMLLSWPPSPLPARRAYRPEGKAYGSESDTRASTFSIAQQSIPEKKRRWPSASPPTANAWHWRAGQANAGRALQCQAGFSQQRMTYIQKETKVYKLKDGKQEKVFNALEWLAAMSCHIPDKGESRRTMGADTTAITAMSLAEDG